MDGSTPMSETEKQTTSHLSRLACASVAASLLFLISASSSWPSSSSSASSSPEFQDADSPSTSPVEVNVEVASLIYGEEKMTGVCFSSGYLDLLARESNIRTARDPMPVDAQSEDLFKYAFAVMTGEGDFILGETEIENLRRYLESGGFILASAGCSNAAWDKAFRRELKRVLPGREMLSVPIEHEIFHTVFDVDELQTRRGSAQVELYGVEFDERIALVYSPQGLNDTGNAGGGCCCCGGNEIRNSKYINANILAYALMK